MREVEVSPELDRRIREAKWTIYVCAEPDGQDCASGTHPNILMHRCAAIERFHRAEGHDKGPTIVAVPVRFVEDE